MNMHTVNSTGVGEKSKDNFHLIAFEKGKGRTTLKD